TDDLRTLAREGDRGRLAVAPAGTGRSGSEHDCNFVLQTVGHACHPRTRFGNQVARPGTNVRSPSTRSAKARNGSTSRVACSSETRARSEVRLRHNPTGGVMRPMQRLTTMTTETWIGSSPSCS